jgi:ethanolamine utilization microcompartment shell protein EutS
MNPHREVTQAFLAVEPLINRILAFGEILMAAGASPQANITPASVAIIGGDIAEAADQIASLLKGGTEAEASEA